jgi:hypothetical protein
LFMYVVTSFTPFAYKLRAKLKEESF